MKQKVNKAEWHEYRRICRNCVFWRAEDDNTALGVCALTDTLTYEMRKACNDLRFTVYDTER